LRKLLLLGLVSAFGSYGFGQAFTETEPNDSKATANFFSPTGAGFTISGNSTGASTTTAGPTSADYFRLKMFNAAPGIYRHRLVLTSAIAGHTGTLRGLSQTAGAANPTSDAVLQTSSTATTPARFNQWYGFGKGEELFYRVTGTASTTADYVATHSVEQITPMSLGSFQPGTLEITTVGMTGATQTDTTIWVYDSNFNAIPGYGNEDEPAPGTTLGSRLTRNFAAGTYYLMVSNFRTANNQTAPFDDRWQTGNLTDFPNIAINSSTTANLNVSFQITDMTGAQFFQAFKAGPYDIVWAQFEVVPEPGTMLALGAGIAALAARRRARKA
jgi:hypothetical protein